MSSERAIEAGPGPWTCSCGAWCRCGAGGGSPGGGGDGCRGLCRCPIPGRPLDPSLLPQGAQALGLGCKGVQHGRNLLPSNPARVDVAVPPADGGVRGRIAWSRQSYPQLQNREAGAGSTRASERIGAAAPGGCLPAGRVEWWRAQTLRSLCRQRSYPRLKSRRTEDRVGKQSS